MNVDARAGRGHQPSVPGDVIGVLVRLQHVVDRDRAVAGQLEVLVDLEARIDDRGDAGALVADQVGGAAEVVVGDLPKDHGYFLGQGDLNVAVELTGVLRSPFSAKITSAFTGKPPLGHFFGTLA